MMKKRLCLWMLLPMLLLGGCGVGNKMEDGFYTAEMAEYSHGWKEYLCIFVKNDKIVYAEFPITPFLTILSILSYPISGKSRSIFGL